MAQRPEGASVLPYSSTVNLDFNLDPVRQLTLAGDVTFTTSNKAITRSKAIRIIADASVRAFTFPAGWVWVGSAVPTSINANKTAILSLYCFGPNETDVVASYAVQQ